MTLACIGEWQGARAEHNLPARFSVYLLIAPGHEIDKPTDPEVSSKNVAVANLAEKGNALLEGTKFDDVGTNTVQAQYKCRCEGI